MSQNGDERAPRQDVAAQPAGAGEALDTFLDQEAMEERLHRIRRKIIVRSGKGGVGKSTVAVIENMSGFVCPKCGEVTNIFKAGGGEQMARDMGVPFLGRIPIDPAIDEACDAGRPFVHDHSRTETAKAFARIIAPILSVSE